jgi:hypothetical protein
MTVVNGLTRAKLGRADIAESEVLAECATRWVQAIRVSRVDIRPFGVPPVGI